MTQQTADRPRPSSGSPSVQEELRRQYKKNGRLKKAVRSLLKSPTGLLGFILLLAVILIAALSPFLIRFDPNEVHILDKLLPPSWANGGKPAYLLGTDYLGRDIYSRILDGAHISIIVGLVSVAFAGSIGMVVGLVSGYFGGWVDALIMRIVDAIRTIPTILLNVVIAMIMGPGIRTVIIAIAFTTWTHYARIVRGEVLSVRQREYVLSARAVGARNSRIIFTDIMPNVMSTFIVTCTSSVAQAIITESSLSFLGLGITPPSVTWGSILSDGRNYLATAWWVSTFPGIAICITCLGIMFFGDWLRDFLDPRINANS